MVKEKMVDAKTNSDDLIKPSVEIAAGFFLAAISIFSLLWLIPNTIVAVDAPNDVGPEFFPKMAAWAVLGLSLLLIVTRVRTLRFSEVGMQGRSILIEIAIWLAISVVSVVGLLNIGFLIISPLIILFGAILCGYRNVWTIAIVTIAVPLILDQAAWIIFTVDLP